MAKNNKIKQIGLVLVGQVFISAALSLMLVVNLGVDPQSVFHTGVSNFLGISFGAAIFFENLIIIILIFFIDKKYINLATIMALFVVSLTSSTFTKLFTNLLSNELNIVFKVVLLIIACSIFALGLNLYILADLGIGAMDAMAEIISEKTSKEFRYVKIITDFIFLGVGWILGGAVGIGTLITAFVMGPIIQKQRDYLEEPVKKFIQ